MPDAHMVMDVAISIIVDTLYLGIGFLIILKLFILNKFNKVNSMLWVRTDSD